MLLNDFQVGEWVYFHIKLKKSSLQIGSSGKMAPRFCGPLNIIERIEPITYRLELPPTLKLHNISMFHFLRSILKMLTMWLNGLYCRWNQMENSSQSHSVYCRKKCSCTKHKKSSKLRCNGSTLGLIKVHGRWKIKCGLCILHCLSVEETKFWYGVLVYVLVYVLAHVLVMFDICTYVYGCKYQHELYYKSPISGMCGMSLWCYVCYVFMLIWF